jgi:hypothetical protein
MAHCEKKLMVKINNEDYKLDGKGQKSKVSRAKSSDYIRGLDDDML